MSRIYLGNPYLLKWYGVKDQPITSYKTTNHWLSQSGDSLYLDGQFIGDNYPKLAGAVEIHSLLVITHNQKISLFTNTGELVESLSAENGLPEPIYGLAHTDNKLVLRGQQQSWQTDGDFLGLRAYQGNANWSQAVATPHNIIKAINKHQSGNTISLEKLLLDLHSGRFFGQYGVWIMDGAAIALIIMAASGIWIWFKRRQVR